MGLSPLIPPPSPHMGLSPAHPTRPGRPPQHMRVPRRRSESPALGRRRRAPASVGCAAERDWDDSGSGGGRRPATTGRRVRGKGRVRREDEAGSEEGEVDAAVERELVHLKRLFRL